MAMDIAGAVGLVTGGNRGIGEAFVRALIGAGAAKVYVGTRDVVNAQHLVEEGQGRIIALALDVSRPEQIAAAAVACPDVSIIVNNAGAFVNQRLIGAETMDAAREEMEVNYFGLLGMCRAFAPILKVNGGGAIVNILSSGGVVAVPAMGGYSPSKFAARAATTSIRAELAKQGTSVSALIVGSVDTRMAAHVGGAKERPEDIAKVGLSAIKRGTDEVDTDRMAIEVRAHKARDPKAQERALARMLDMDTISTGR
ncbi:SDR family oxidoreductase [Sphingomonas sp. ERG5]|uniref:SDR family oxidoreductase n=1 Tax=Sphingomonas sp. ERG5 TaxID=1381597 RepID=UPI000AB7F3F4|nr:SDR family oxidoreductase [Sphingomonas sp. ERG5]